MIEVCLFGASGHGKVVKEVIESEGNSVLAFFDDNPRQDTLLYIPIFKADKLKEFFNKKFIISIGDNIIRKKISKEFNLNYIISKHKTSIISKTTYIDEGTVIMAGAVINSDAKIGKHCIINTNAIIEHDCIIENYVHISPNATITGNVEIGEGTHIGAGAVLIPNIKIGKWVVVGAGAIVLNEVPDYAVVVGNPARIVRFNKV